MGQTAASEVLHRDTHDIPLFPWAGVSQFLPLGLHCGAFLDCSRSWEGWQWQMGHSVSPAGHGGGWLMPYGPMVAMDLAVSQWLVIPVTPAQAEIPVLPS